MKKWFKELALKIKNFFNRLGGYEIEKVIYDAVELVEQLKELLQKDYVTWLASSTKSDTDDKLLAFLLEFIPHFQDLLKDNIKFGTCFKSDVTDIEKLICIFDVINYIKDNQNGYFKKLLKDIARLIAKGKNPDLENIDIDADIEVAYLEIKR